MKESYLLKVFWSGDAVFPPSRLSALSIQQVKARFSKVLSSRNYSFLDVRIWLPGFYGFVNGFRSIVYRFTIDVKFDSLILLCVCVNTIIMALEGTIVDKEGIRNMEYLSTVFTFTFAAELVLKNVSLGTVDYLRDKINVFDACLVSISLVEYF